MIAAPESPPRPVPRSSPQRRVRRIVAWLVATVVRLNAAVGEGFARLERSDDRRARALVRATRRGHELIERSGQLFDADPAAEPPGKRAIVIAGLLGLAASALITVGASQDASPYTFKGLPIAWYFGIAHPAYPYNVGPPTTGFAPLFGVLAVLFGMVMLIGVWGWLVRLRSRFGLITWGQCGALFAAFVVPMLVVAPLFSRDVYSYVAQGEMTAHHISPYNYGPGVLGINSYNSLTDSLWRWSPSPYGPLFLQLAAWATSAAGGAELASVVLLRLLALVGVLLATAGVVLIARRLGRDPLRAVLLVALNPLLLFHLVAGAHNDALMVGLVTLGVAAALYDHRIVGIVLCALGASIKAPAALGVVFIAWELGRTRRSPAGRLAARAAGCGLGLGVMELLSLTTGLGWNWVKGLSNANGIHLWLDPPSALGLLIEKALNLIGVHDPHGYVFTMTRGLGILTMAWIALHLLRSAERIGLARAVGFGLLAIALLTPAVQPWYLVWGLVILAPVVTGAALRNFVAGSAFGAFLGVPVGSVLIQKLEGIPAWAAIGLCLAFAAAVATAIDQAWPKSALNWARRTLVRRQISLEGQTVQP